MLFTRPCSPSTGVYNPKAFVPHAASLGQAVAHCRRFSTAATRRCLGSVSVPVCRATLARPVGVEGLVGRYPTNNLIPRRPVPRRTRTFGQRPMPVSGVMGDYSKFPSAVPPRGVGYRRLTHPCATPPRGVRLACLIHAANVHSEPGSNPSKCDASHPKMRAAGPPRPRTPKANSGVGRIVGGEPREGPPNTTDSFCNAPTSDAPSEETAIVSRRAADHHGVAGPPRGSTDGTTRGPARASRSRFDATPPLGR